MLAQLHADRAARSAAAPGATLASQPGASARPSANPVVTANNDSMAPQRQPISLLTYNVW